MKRRKKYFFSVEGQTEKWYLDKLQSMINTSQESKYIVNFECPVQKNPVKRAKTAIITGKVNIYHIFDYESSDAIHQKEFINTLDMMKNASKMGKQIKYRLGYSNLTFELWMILHKTDFSTHLSDRKQYLQYINRAYNEKFENLPQYKQEDNFKRILNQLTIHNVKDAVKRAKFIMRKNSEDGNILRKYKGYEYFEENPSLSVWEVIDQILIDCNL
ncbi:RloB domain-containing protein [Pseudothermotoga sp.]|uniref:RloB domain-containing protein n=1 Tax=Pseudothermotoga sp. TaxID=2033661 RepID=UPI00257EBFD7|nr:RloB domain-containing protein [Pseudothermotoga sp.]